ncbi:DUF1887 family CARF protein [Runella sp. MFBS21]|uniref:Card1-like endonuclease domain-containing protein n=1 Tax=Runella sp. MFBS21 TaxID=3034018 RepID=UPI0023F89A17|nr:DUF1887 family CARF protein [Runella sp. MFBS21]MDF7818113.1 DUF1887 family CARF protein [Runella sp. MFBS21]
MSITDELNEKKTLDFSEYSYVCASTLNQMVNYIPLVMDEFKFKDFYTVTLYKDINLTTKVKGNKKWDENLQKTLDKNTIALDEIKIEQNEFLKVSKTIEAFDKVLKDKKTFWNLTGGQRPFVLAVLEYVKDKPEHYIAYLEGNTGQISVKSAHEEILIPYSLPKGTNIETALKLMGFNAQSTLSMKKSDKEEQEFWLDFYEKYKNTSSNLRENLVLLNKKKHENGTNFTQSDKESFWKKIYQLCQLDIHNDNSYLRRFRLGSKNQFPFGYILEEMCFHVLYDTAVKYSLGIYSSVRTYSIEAESQLDEFDILILTNQGTILNIECKSGIMDGDVAKSTKYSTYAISGVYGKPTLITPLLENEISNTTPKYPLQKSFDAINAAIKAGLPIWSIDKIKKELEEIIKDNSK